MIRIQFLTQGETLEINSEKKSYNILQSLVMNKNVSSFGTFQIRYKQTIVKTEDKGIYEENYVVMRNTLTKIYINNRLKMIGVVISIKRTISVEDGIHIDVSGADFLYCLSNYTTNIANFVQIQAQSNSEPIFLEAFSTRFTNTTDVLGRTDDNLKDFIINYTKDYFVNYLDFIYDKIISQGTGSIGLNPFASISDNIFSQSLITTNLTVKAKFRFSNGMAYSDVFDESFIVFNENTRIQKTNSLTINTFNIDNYYSIIKKAVTPTLNSLIYDTLDIRDIEDLGGIFNYFPRLNLLNKEFYCYVGQSIYDLNFIKNSSNIGITHKFIETNRIESIIFESYNTDLASLYLLIPSTYVPQTFVSNGSMVIDEQALSDYGLKLHTVTTPGTSLVSGKDATDGQKKQILQEYRDNTVYLKDILTGVRNTFVVTMIVKDFYIKVGSVVVFVYYKNTYTGVVDGVSDSYLTSNGFSSTLRISRVFKF